MPDDKFTYLENNIERRQDKLEEVADRLTNISSDLSKMLAVHEQRLNQHERQLIADEARNEKRKEEYDEKLGIVFKKIDGLREAATANHAVLADRIIELEKQIWRIGGAIAVLAFVFAYGPSILKILDLK